MAESAEVRRLADDDVLHRLEQLGACGVGGQVQRLAQRVELEHVVMVPGTRGSARSEVRSAADAGRPDNRALWKRALRDGGGLAGMFQAIQ